MPQAMQLPKTVPYGFRREGNRLVVDPNEGPIRKQLLTLFIEHSRKKTVARLLNEAGFRTREGAPFSDTTVGRMLLDPIVKGVVDASGNVLVERLIDDSTWDQCQSILTGREAGQKVGRVPVHLFAGIAACVCGQKMYVPSDSDKYVCQACRNKIPVSDLERVFFEQFRTSFLVHAKRESDANSERELVQVWPLMDAAEKRKAVETMLDSVVVGDGDIAFRVSYLPSAENAAKGQRGEKGNKPDLIATHVESKGRMKINVSSRELWDSDENLTHTLTETTKNFLAVLGLNVANHVNSPLDPDSPFADGATATAKSALDMLRRQIGAGRCKRLVQLERRRGDKPGGIKLANVEVVGTGRRDVVRLRSSDAMSTRSAFRD